MQVSGREIGWERIGELTGDLMGDPTGLCGETMGDLVGEPGRDEAGTVAGDGAVVGEGTEEGEGHCGLLATGDAVALSSFVSSGLNGSGKKPVPGGFMRGVCKETQKVRFLSRLTRLTVLGVYLSH